jgi:hypothetical protein
MLIRSVHDGRLACQETPLSIFEQENVGKAAIQNLIAVTLAQLARGSGMNYLASHHNAHVPGDG